MNYNMCVPSKRICAQIWNPFIWNSFYWRREDGRSEIRGGERREQGEQKYQQMICFSAANSLEKLHQFTSLKSFPPILIKYAIYTKNGK